MTTQTVDDADSLHPAASPPLPGIVLVFAAGELQLRAVAVGRRGAVIGRDEGLDLTLPEERASRRHAMVRWRQGGFSIEDLGSRNGTAVDGVAIDKAVDARPGAVIRIGRSLLLTCADVRPFETLAVEDLVRDQFVIGPRLRAVLTTIETLARAGNPVMITGESGAGKELAAHVYHRGSGRTGPLVPVNCAAIPVGVAERLLFGSRRGAFSGAADAKGLLEAADGGTLFLDELGELDLEVQAKLLRVLETGEVVPLGATSGRVVDLRIVAATNRNLRTQVAERRFREDLFFRIGQPEVALPPLRERPEEIPSLIVREIASLDPDLTAHVDLVEACCVRPWPGNVRELRAAIRQAALAAQQDRGEAGGADVVRAKHLSSSAGLPFAPSPPSAPARPQELGREEVLQALAQCEGNVAAAARQLGLHRTQLYRLLARLGIEDRGKG